MSRNRSRRKSDSGDATQPNVDAVRRREVLKGSIGGAVLLAAPDLFRGKGATSARSPGAGKASPASQPYFFVYGIPGPDPSPGPSLGAARSPAFTRSVPVALSTVATQLAALPAESPDASTLALVSLDGTSGVAKLTVLLVDRRSGAAVSRGTLPLPKVPKDASLLVTPVFGADRATVALVLSVSVPTNQRIISKPGPGAGGTRLVPAATWVCHHELAFFDGSRSSFTGPYDLADAPSLARVNAGADAETLFVWTVEEYVGTKGRPAPPPVPRLTAFPLGSGASRFSVPAPGPWPVSQEPVVTLASGDVARLVDGVKVQVYSARSGAVSEFPIAPLNVSSAKPAVTTLQLRPDGLVFLAKPGVGRAVLADPARSFAVLSAISYPVPHFATGGPASKAVLSADGKLVYTLGGADVGGLSAYSVPGGSLVASYSRGEQYTGVYQLASGTLLATSLYRPRLSFFSPSLTPLGRSNTDLHVTAVF